HDPPRQPAAAARDHGPSGGHRLERGDAEPLLERRQRDDVGGRETGGDVAPEAGEADRVSERRRVSNERVGLPARAAEDVAEAERSGREPLRGGEKNRMALSPPQGAED